MVLSVVKQIFFNCVASYFSVVVISDLRQMIMKQTEALFLSKLFWNECISIRKYSAFWFLGHIALWGFRFKSLQFEFNYMNDKPYTLITNCNLISSNSQGDQCSQLNYIAKSNKYRTRTAYIVFYQEFRDRFFKIL